MLNLVAHFFYFNGSKENVEYGRCCCESKNKFGSAEFETTDVDQKYHRL
jgi:hypothetical protein